MASDLAAECLTYEEAIWHAGGIDLQLVGIGMDGHIGFNEPMSSLQSRTRVKQLNPVTIRQNAGYFGGADKMPRRAITMGVGTILDSQRCVLLATGSAKAEILAEAIEGPFCARVTASALQWHRRAVVIVDEACAANLKNREYYDWSFAHEPEWAPFRG
jgi:glucosamine-6-phosphate deaminase